MSGHGQRAVSIYGVDTGARPTSLHAVTTTRQITLEIPVELLERALAVTGEAITPTVQRGLELVAAGQAYEERRRLRGKVRLGIDLEALHEDR